LWRTQRAPPQGSSCGESGVGLQPVAIRRGVVGTFRGKLLTPDAAVSARGEREKACGARKVAEAQQRAVVAAKQRRGLQ
jgi:hypothetical protein